MSLLLDRNEDGRYELQHEGVVISRFDTLSWALDRATRFAKNHAQKLFVSTACISDWYVGFNSDKTKVPQIIQCSDLTAIEAKAQEFRFIEGPFESQELAEKAAFKISGQTIG